jgi:hypothetical protein
MVWTLAGSMATPRGYGVPKVGDNIHAEGALGALDEEAMLAKDREDNTEVTQMVCPGGADGRRIGGRAW